MLVHLRARLGSWCEMCYAQVRLDERPQRSGRDRRPQPHQGSPDQTQVQRANHVRVFDGQRLKRAGAQPDLHVRTVRNGFRLEAEFGEHRDQVPDRLLGGQAGGLLLVAARERVTGLLGQATGARAAGCEVAGEDVGEQRGTIRTRGVGGGGVDQPGSPGAAPRVGAATGQPGADQDSQVETYRVGVQAAVRGDLRDIQRAGAIP